MCCQARGHTHLEKLVLCLNPASVLRRGVVLQPSLTGHGAKVAIICNVTPASSQSEETWNTLRFADGAKRIKVGGGGGAAAAARGSLLHQHAARTYA